MTKRRSSGGRENGLQAFRNSGNRLNKSKVQQKLRDSNETADVSVPQHQRRRDGRDNAKPPRFPGFKGPSDRFVDPSHPQFSEILRTSYEGFRLQGPDSFESKVHENARKAFDALENGGVFRADVTQPFGLGTKCAATYVTRTLVGEPGSTYKYLGLRMFSHPWREDEGEMADGFERIRALNDHLKERSKKLLEEKDQKCAETRRGERQTGIQGDEVELGVDASSYEFNVALINRMQPSEERPDLKAEPTFGQDRCAVSWHADSCLEHYSTIAVYHATDPEVESGTDWRIALRVEHDAEGPTAGKLKHPASDKKNDGRAPPVAVGLPSRAAYFLLDEFNHHHQHAVLAGKTHR